MARPTDCEDTAMPPSLLKENVPPKRPLTDARQALLRWILANEARRNAARQATRISAAPRR